MAWIAGLSLLQREGDGSLRRIGVALLMGASPRGEHPLAGESEPDARRWAEGMVSRLAARLRARGWNTEEASEAFHLDDAFGDVNFESRKEEGARAGVEPGLYAIGDARSGSLRGEAALRRAMEDLERAAREEGLAGEELAREIRGFGEFDGKPGFADGRGVGDFSDEAMAEELFARVEASRLRAAAGQARGEAPGARKGRRL